MKHMFYNEHKLRKIEASVEAANYAALKVDPACDCYFCNPEHIEVGTQVQVESNGVVGENYDRLPIYMEITTCKKCGAQQLI